MQLSNLTIEPKAVALVRFVLACATQLGTNLKNAFKSQLETVSTQCQDQHYNTEHTVRPDTVITRRQSCLRMEINVGMCGNRYKHTRSLL